MIKHASFFTALFVSINSFAMEYCGQETRAQSLKLAIQKGDLQSINDILQYGVDPNYITPAQHPKDLQQSPLQLAVVHYRVKPEKTEQDKQYKKEQLTIFQNIIIALLAAGADPNLPQPHNNAKTEARWEPELLDTLLYPASIALGGNPVHKLRAMQITGKRNAPPLRPRFNKRKPTND